MIPANITPINQPYMTPKLGLNDPNNPFLNFSIKSDDFLNGTINTYFAPGQWPYGITDVYGYTKPTKWALPGNLLRVPQIVCFNFSISPIVSGDNAIYDSGFDYLGTALQVKQTIESLRPNITFVDIMTWAYADIAHFFYLGGNPYPNNYSQSFFFNPPNINVPFYQWMTAPNPNETFFGTNFLQIYVTGPTQMPTGNSFAIVNNVNDTIYKQGKSRIVGCYPKFTGFNVWLYSLSESYSLQLAGGIPVTYAAYLNAMQFLANDLPGYTYMGDAQTGIQTDNLIQAIAQNFNFDPQTGLDLPAGVQISPNGIADNSVGGP